MRNLYLDLDDTVLDTSSFLGGVDLLKYLKQNIDGYSRIPYKVGALDSLRILSTKYSISFVSCYLTEDEKREKLRFARLVGVPIFLCRDYYKGSVDMSGGIFVDDDVKHLIESSASLEDSYCFGGGEYETNLGYTCVNSWSELCDILMEVSVDAELREYFCKRIPRGCSGYRV